MSYSERISDLHWEELVAQIREHLTLAGSVELAQGLESGEFERLEVLLDYLLVVSAGVAQELPTDALIQAVDAVLRRIDRQLFDPENPSQPAGTHPTDFTAAVTELAEFLSRWPSPATFDVTGAATAYRRSLGQQLKSLKESIDTLESGLASIREEAQAEGAALANESANARRELQAQVTEFEGRIATASASIDSAVNRSDQALANFQQQFTTAEQKRLEEYAKAARNLSQQVDSLTQDLEAKAQEALDRIREQEQHAEEMVGVFVAAGTANAYGNEANDQQRAADLWRLVAAGTAALAVVFAIIFIFWFRPEQADDWAGITGRSLLILTLGGLAAYCARQSAAHRRREERARQLHLDVVAFGPFVQELDDEKRAEARAALVEKIFGRDPTDGHARSRPTGLDDSDINLLGKLGETLATMMQRFR